MTTLKEVHAALRRATKKGPTFLVAGTLLYNGGTAFVEVTRANLGTATVKDLRDVGAAKYLVRYERLVNVAVLDRRAL